MIRLVVLLLSFLILSGCSGYFSQSFVYEPTHESASRLDLGQAKRIVANAFSHCYSSSSRYINSFGYRTDAIADIEFFDDHYSYKSKTDGTGYNVYYKDMRNIKMDYHAMHEWPDYFDFSWDGRLVNSYLKKEFPTVTGDCNMVYPDGPMPFDTDAKIVVDAVLRLQMEFDKSYGPEAEQAFKKRADEYLALAEKPAAPEQVKTYEIQAAAAFGKKNFETAVELYGKALEIAPWWAPGYYNRALILAELNSTDAAMIEMQRYLYLRPDAPNAELVKRKIAEWGTPAY